MAFSLISSSEGSLNLIGLSLVETRIREVDPPDFSLIIADQKPTWQGNGKGSRWQYGILFAPKGEEAQKPVTDIRSPRIWACCGGPGCFCNWSVRDSHVPIGMQTGNIHTSGKQVCLPSVDKDHPHDAVHSRFIT